MLKGSKHTKKAKQKIQQKALEQFKNGMPEKTKKKIKQSTLGKKCSIETKEKMRKNHKGMLGKYLSKETKEKIRQKALGRKHSKATKEKCRQMNLGRKASKETREKMRKPKSEEHKQKIKENHVDMNGKKHWNWKGGISFKPYGLEFNENLKEVIRNRDRRKCQICKKTELENKVKLSIHHIDYNKKNNNPNNLISLCRKCHIKTNYNREYWIKHFKYE